MSDQEENLSSGF